MEITKNTFSNSQVIGIVGQYNLKLKCSVLVTHSLFSCYGQLGSCQIRIVDVIEAREAEERHVLRLVDGVERGHVRVGAGEHVLRVAHAVLGRLEHNNRM